MMKRAKRWPVLGLALWLVLGPIWVQATAEPLVAASELGFILQFFEEKGSGHRVPLEHAKNAVRQQLAARSQAETNWLMTRAGCVTLMGEAGGDVAALYNALATVKRAGDLAFVPANTQNAIAALLNLGAFVVGKFEPGSPAAKTLAMMAHRVQGVAQWVRSDRLSKAIQFYEAPGAPGEEVAAMWRRLGVVTEEAKAFEETVDGARQLGGAAEGVAKTIGVGLQLLGIALDSYKLATSEDLAAGNAATYSVVSTQVSLLMGMLGLAMMFISGPAGWVVGLVAFGTWVINEICEIIGADYQRWVEAYRDSFWFLQENCQDFRSTWSHRQYVYDSYLARPDTTVIAESWKRARNLKDALAKDAAPRTDEERKVAEQSQKVLLSMERQGVLMTYYQDLSVPLPDKTLPQLMEMWENKADYMSYRPHNEQEKREGIGFWNNVWSLFSEGGDDFQQQWNAMTREKEIVYFNPDFYLVRRYLETMGERRMQGDRLWSHVALRCEESPYSQLPLIEYLAEGKVSKEVLEDAIVADTLTCAIKEIRALIGIVKQRNEQGVKPMIAKGVERVEGLVSSGQAGKIKAAADLLTKLARKAKDDPDTADAALNQDLARKFGWTVAEGATPKETMQAHASAINSFVGLAPLIVANLSIEIAMSWAALYDRLGEEAQVMNEDFKAKQKVIGEIPGLLKTEKYRDFITKGETLTFNRSRWQKFVTWVSNTKTLHQEATDLGVLFANAVTDFAIALKPIEKAKATFVNAVRQLGQAHDALRTLNGYLADHPELGVDAPYEKEDPKVFPPKIREADEPAHSVIGQLQRKVVFRNTIVSDFMQAAQAELEREKAEVYGPVNTDQVPDQDPMAVARDLGLAGAAPAAR